MSYNGFSNWATWATVLNVNNVEAMYHRMNTVESAEELRQWVETAVERNGTFGYDIEAEDVEDIDFQEAFEALTPETEFNIEFQDENGDLHYVDYGDTLEEAVELAEDEMKEKPGPYVISTNDRDGEREVHEQLWPND